MGEEVVINRREVQILKINEGLQIVKGIVYKPYEVDSQGEWMTPEDIRKAAYTFMEDMNINKIDTSHNFQKVDAFVCESYIVVKGDPDGYPEGSWVVAVKINDLDLWDSVLKGEYKAFSMAGKGIRTEEDPPEVINKSDHHEKILKDGGRIKKQESDEDGEPL